MRNNVILPYILFRLDASEVIGTGHLMRCVALASAFKLRGMHSVFVCRDLNKKFVTYLEKLGFDSFQNGYNTDLQVEEECLSSSWTDQMQKLDASDTINILKKLESEFGLPFVLIVDHYSLNAVWEKTVTERYDLPICAIDDLDREHQCSYILDTTFGKTKANYQNKIPRHCETMIGSKYSMLRPEFAVLRESSLRRRDQTYVDSSSVKDLVIAFGGADHDNITSRLLSAIEVLPKKFDFNVHVLIGAAYGHKDQLITQIETSRFTTELHHNITDVASLFAKADICIGASGSSTWERCCLGLPTVNLVIAENQKQIAEILGNSRMLVNATLPKGDFSEDNYRDWNDKYLIPLLSQSSFREDISVNMRKATDGFGLLHIISVLVKKFVLNHDVELTHASGDDAQLVYQWQSFPEMRKYSINKTVPTWDNHLKWYANKLREPNSDFYIAKVNGLKVGVVRLDEFSAKQELGDPKYANDTCKLISILTGPEFQGMKLGKRALIELQKRHTKEILVARVFQENTASVALFRSVGFKQIENEYYRWCA